MLSTNNWIYYIAILRIFIHFIDYHGIWLRIETGQTLFTAKNVLSCIQAKLDSIKAKLTSERHRQDENIDKLSTRQSIDERNNNSDYEEPCKRPKIDLGSCSPIHSVNQFAKNIKCRLPPIFCTNEAFSLCVIVTMTKAKQSLFDWIILVFPQFYWIVSFWLILRKNNNEPHWKMTWYEELTIWTDFDRSSLIHSRRIKTKKNWKTNKTHRDL